MTPEQEATLNRLVRIAERELADVRGKLSRMRKRPKSKRSVNLTRLDWLTREEPRLVAMLGHYARLRTTLQELA